MSDFYDPPAIVRQSVDLKEMAAQINSVHELGEKCKYDSLQHYRRAGELLIKARSQCRHSEWLPWLKENVRFSRKTACKYMELSKCLVYETFEEQWAEWQRISGNAPWPEEVEPENADEQASSKPTDVEQDGESSASRGASELICEVDGEIFREKDSETGQYDRCSVNLPHVTHNSGDNEWYTPSEYIEAARIALGEIELDPASSHEAQKTVGATNYYTKEDDGLTKVWTGKVWMNPPYSSSLVSSFVEKLCHHFAAGEVSEAVVLTNNATETSWFQMMARHASLICFPSRRIRFVDKDGKFAGQPLQGQAVCYLGDNSQKFDEAFGGFGFILRCAKGRL